MTTMKKLTDEEKLEILEASLAERRKGNDDEALRITQRLPLHWRLVKVSRDFVGIKGLKEMGFDLSEAQEVLPREWFNEE